MSDIDGLQLSVWSWFPCSVSSCDKGFNVDNNSCICATAWPSLSLVQMEVPHAVKRWTKLRPRFTSTMGRWTMTVQQSFMHLHQKMRSNVSDEEEETLMLIDDSKLQSAIVSTVKIRSPEAWSKLSNGGASWHLGDEGLGVGQAKKVGLKALSSSPDRASH